MCIHQRFNIGEVIFEEKKVTGVAQIDAIIGIILVDIVGVDEKFIEGSDVDVGWRFSFSDEINCISCDCAASGADMKGCGGTDRKECD